MTSSEACVRAPATSCALVVVRICLPEERLVHRVRAVERRLPRAACTRRDPGSRSDRRVRDLAHPRRAPRWSSPSRRPPVPTATHQAAAHSSLTARRPGPSRERPITVRLKHGRQSAVRDPPTAARERTAGGARPAVADPRYRISATAIGRARGRRTPITPSALLGHHSLCVRNPVLPVGERTERSKQWHRGG
jgi:hypothetical protein